MMAEQCRCRCVLFSSSYPHSRARAAEGKRCTRWSACVAITPMSIAEILYVWAKVVNWREARRKRKSMQQYETVEQDFIYFRPVDTVKDIVRIKKLEVWMPQLNLCFDLRPARRAYHCLQGIAHIQKCYWYSSLTGTSRKQM